jgi:DNA-binding protein H-NS
MQKSGVTVADIEAYIGKNKRGAMHSTAIATHATPAAKYVDPKTGATWSGHGSRSSLDCECEGPQQVPR